MISCIVCENYLNVYPNSAYMLYYVEVKKMEDLGAFLERCVASTRI